MWKKLNKQLVERLVEQPIFRHGFGNENWFIFIQEDGGIGLSYRKTGEDLPLWKLKTSFYSEKEFDEGMNWQKIDQSKFPDEMSAMISWTMHDWEEFTPTLKP